MVKLWWPITRVLWCSNLDFLLTGFTPDKPTSRPWTRYYLSFLYLLAINKHRLLASMVTHVSKRLMIEWRGHTDGSARVCKKRWFATLRKFHSPRSRHQFAEPCHHPRLDLTVSILEVWIMGHAITSWIPFVCFSYADRTQDRESSFCYLGFGVISKTFSAKGMVTSVNTRDRIFGVIIQADGTSKDIRRNPRKHICLLCQQSILSFERSLTF